MCGIVGLYQWPAGDAVLDGMVDRLSHRGPDASGAWRSAGDGPDVRLGHLRLSIIDLSEAANQPFVKDGLVLIFNGEIYNYRALRDELTSAGASFTTESDTEVIVEAWRRWGPGSLPRLRGMFAFALYDERTGGLVLARDPFGIKPLYVARRGEGLAFGSELKALRPLLDRDALAIDRVALTASLLYSWIPESHCIYAGVEKLPAGHWAELRPDGRFRTTAYWDPVAELVESPRPVVDARELAEVMRDSVAAHLVADVPVATFLSGGLDSSLITVMAAELSGSIESYTISFREEDRKLEAMPDDLKYARQLAERSRIDLHVIEIDPDVTDMLPRMVRILDEPIGDAAAINAYLICQAARDAGVKVLLSGMGADELFAGYRKHLASVLASSYRRLPRFVRQGLIEPVADRLPVAGRRRGYRTVRWAKRFLSFADLEEARAFQRSYTHYGADELCALLDGECDAAVAQLEDEHAELYRQGPAGDQINRMCYTDTNLFLPSLNLAYTDRASMAASTEVRVPFVDREVVRTAFAIPGSQKIVGRHGKAILKKAAEPWLPHEIVYRPKALFSAPLRAWVRRDLREMVDDLLLSGELVGQGILRRERVQALVDEDRAGEEDRSKQIWHLMTLETWFRQHREALDRRDEVELPRVAFGGARSS